MNAFDVSALLIIGAEPMKPTADTAVWFKSETYNPVTLLMDYLDGCNMKIVLAIFLLFIQFCARQFVNKEWDEEKFITSIWEFPINIVFLSMSLLTALLINPAGTWSRALKAFVFFVLLAMLVVATARYTVNMYNKGYKTTWRIALFAGLNYFVSLSALLFTFGELSK